MNAKMYLEDEILLTSHDERLRPAISACVGSPDSMACICSGIRANLWPERVI